MLNKTLLLTGFTGFVGKALLNNLEVKELKLLGRTTPNSSEHQFYQGEIDSETDFSAGLKNVDVLIHTAARAHVMNEESRDPQQEYIKVNTLGTLNLARQAAAAGVKRFIFISSIKVNGEATEFGKPFTHLDTMNTSDPYGYSKMKAEEGLHKISAETGMEFVIIRPPLIYGPGVKANFAAMMKLASRNLPLPLGAIKNKRSLVALDNLIDLIVKCVDHPKASNQTFLVSDDDDVSTTELLRLMIRSVGKRPLLLPIPSSWLMTAGKLIGKQAVVERLCGNLQVDINHTKILLDWKPPISVKQGIERCFINEELF